MARPAPVEVPSTHENRPTNHLDASASIERSAITPDRAIDPRARADADRPPRRLDLSDLACALIASQYSLALVPPPPPPPPVARLACCVAVISVSRYLGVSHTYGAALWARSCYVGHLAALGVYLRFTRDASLAPPLASAASSVAMCPAAAREVGPGRNAADRAAGLGFDGVACGTWADGVEEGHGGNGRARYGFARFGSCLGRKMSLLCEPRGSKKPNGRNASACWKEKRATALLRRAKKKGTIFNELWPRGHASSGLATVSGDHSKFAERLSLSLSMH